MWCIFSPGYDDGFYWGFFYAIHFACLVISFPLCMIVSGYLIFFGPKNSWGLPKMPSRKVIGLVLFSINYLVVELGVMTGIFRTLTLDPSVTLEIYFQWYSCIFAGILPYHECFTPQTGYPQPLFLWQWWMLSTVGITFAFIFLVISDGPTGPCRQQFEETTKTYLGSRSKSSHGSSRSK